MPKASRFASLDPTSSKIETEPNHHQSQSTYMHVDTVVKQGTIIIFFPNNFFSHHIICTLKLSIDLCFPFYDFKAPISLAVPVIINNTHQPHPTQCTRPGVKYSALECFIRLIFLLFYLLLPDSLFVCFTPLSLLYYLYTYLWIHE